MDNSEKDVTSQDMPTLLYAELRQNGFAGHHIKSMNSFYSIGIRQIITKIFAPQMQRFKNERDKTEEDKAIEFISFSVEFTDVNLQKPTTTKYNSGNYQMLTPNMARLKNLTYSAPLYISAKVTATAQNYDKTTKTRVEELKNFRIASIPVMYGTELCNTNNCSKDTLKKIEEDPQDPGGYFLVKGGEWIVDNTENISINSFHVYKNKHLNEIVRGEFISKPGDAYENSFYIILRYLNNGAITFEITTNKFDKFQIPFYLIFRAFGITRDRDILDHIVYGVDNTDPITLHMLEVLEKSFFIDDKIWNPIKNSIESNEILQYIAQRMNEYASGANYRTDDEATKYVNNSTLVMLDKYIFPHIGLTPEYRIRKMRFLGHLINKLLKVEMDVLSGTDRDSYKNKRIHTAGVSLAKTFKTNFNFVIVQEIKKHLKKDFQSTPFSQVQLVDSIKAAVKTSGSNNGSSDLERVLVQGITSGNKTITVKRNEVSNRIQSEQLYHKNDLNMKSQLRTITSTNASAAKANERAELMRMVHPSHLGYICASQSAEGGEKVGLNKQMAVSCTVCEASSSYALKDIIMQDPDFIALDSVRPAEVTSRKLSKVLVNGDWIGFCEGAEGARYRFVQKYRQMRRTGNIHYQTTVLYDESIREVLFWVDVGRLIRPLVIVYNNIEEYIAAFKRGDRAYQFHQWTKLTKDHIHGLQSGTMTMEDLRVAGILEYITSEELECAYVAPNMDTLIKNRENVLEQYTHVDIDQSILGLVALSAPNANHTGPNRAIMFTNQKKQTCGWFTLNWPYRIDKNTFLQYYCEMPVVKVFSDALTYPNGQNIILAYMMYMGQNQEDSAMFNKTSVERGLFNGSHFNYERTELEKGEMYGNPDFARTLDPKKDAVYEFIEKGFIKEGTHIQKGYVLVVKSVKIPKPIDNKYLYSDKSIVYKQDEPAIVEKVITPRNDEDALIAKVKLRSARPIAVGDKIASRAGNKSIISFMLDQCDMPYAEDGLIPDVILNPHAIPTRMCVGQIIEGMIALRAIKKGCVLDATAFHKLDIKAMLLELESYGIKYGGTRRLYNGKTGNWIDTLIFVAPTGYNRLQKFVVDESYSMSSGPTSALTRQPLEGKANVGGLKLGEMEKDVFVAHGSSRALNEKFYKDSDGIVLPICRLCGKRAIVNERLGMYKCKTCGDNADIANVPSSWVANLIFNEMTAMNIVPRFELESYGY